MEIKYEEFGAKALEVAEQSLDFDKIMHVATSPKVKELDFEGFAEKFKNALLTDPRTSKSFS